MTESSPPSRPPPTATGRKPFSTRQVKGDSQWYFSVREPDQRIHQIHVDPDDAEARALVARAREAAPLERLEPLAKSALAPGCTPNQRKHLSANLDVALQPLRFTEFSVEDVQRATPLDPTGRCVVVSLPAAARVRAPAAPGSR